MWSASPISSSPPLPLSQGSTTGDESKPTVCLGGFSGCLLLFLCRFANKEAEGELLSYRS